MSEATRLDDEHQLHAADPEALEAQIMSLALARTGAHHGALHMWDPGEQGLVLALHVVEGLTVTIPKVLRSGGPPGIALHVFESAAPYLCRDTTVDPYYTRYLLDVGSMAAVPIMYQERPIGVITVASRRTNVFDDEQLSLLASLAESSAKFLRRAQLDRQSRVVTGRPILIKGLSPGWMEVERRIEHAAPTNAPILVRGESGTGKELVSRAIHFNSRRSQAAYITVNCAAIPETMLESILFGHVKGAFTGASFAKIGEFEKADGGTLFLDEVGELPMLLQAKVLRAVEQGEIQPLGSNKPAKQVDVRLICATNRDLVAMAREGKFRDDLYYRLGVMTIELPPLRSYKDNLEVMAHVFVQQAAERNQVVAPRISPEAMELIMAYDYPGNVRELKNALEHAVIMSGSGQIRPTDLPAAFQQQPQSDTPSPAVAPATSAPSDATLREMRETWLAPLERQYLSDLLEACGGNVREAAARAGVNPVTMYRLLRKRGLELRRQVADAAD